MTSVIFARNLGSRDSLKLLTRWDLRLCLRQRLRTVDLLTPCASPQDGNATPHAFGFALERGRRCSSRYKPNTSSALCKAVANISVWVEQDPWLCPLSVTTLDLPDDRC